MLPTDRHIAVGAPYQDLIGFGLDALAEMGFGAVLTEATEGREPRNLFGMRHELQQGSEGFTVAVSIRRRQYGWATYPPTQSHGHRDPRRTVLRRSQSYYRRLI